MSTDNALTDQVQSFYDANRYLDAWERAGLGRLVELFATRSQGELTGFLAAACRIATQYGHRAAWDFLDGRTPAGQSALRGE